MTRSWGLIVAFAKGYDEENLIIRNKIIVLTCNGDIVKEAIIDEQVKYMDHFTDEKGFDHVVYSVENGTIYEFEAYYPENKRVISNDRLEVIGLHVWSHYNLIHIFIIIPNISVFANLFSQPTDWKKDSFLL